MEATVVAVGEGARDKVRLEYFSLAKVLNIVTLELKTDGFSFE